MHQVDLIITLAGSLAVALVFGYFTQRLGLSPIVGYLLAGIAVGPHTPGFVADQKLAEQMAEMGVVLLMFGVGLQFHLEELLAVRRVAVPGAIVQSLVATALAAVLTYFMGWQWSSGIVFGLCISVASTVVLVRVLADNRDLHTPAGHIAVGWLVVEDIFTVLVLVLLPAIFGNEAQGAGSLAWTVAAALIKVSALFAFAFVVGGRVIPWLLTLVAKTRSRELFTLTVLVLALGIAVGSAKMFGVSMALGAFLAGMVVGRSEFSLRAASDALPMRDAFAVLFFVSVGLLLNPMVILEAPGLVVLTLAIILLGKPISALVLVLALGYPLHTALAVAVALSQVGEFSFILATVGRELGLLDSRATGALIAASIVSISLNPLAYRSVDPLARYFSSHRGWLRGLGHPRAGVVAETADDRDADRTSAHRAVVVGYGPVGRTVTRLLRENDVVTTVIELNLDVVQQLRGDGIAAVYGDVRQRETLRAAGVAAAGNLILSSSDLQGSSEVIRMARELNPRIRVLARSLYVAEMPRLWEVGANSVFSGEGEVALAFAVDIMDQLGATPEQIDRERVRVRQELLGGARQATAQASDKGQAVAPRAAATSEPRVDDPS
jgi:CPA2 family monovalent cation:H+ antiporter-2